jgi:hypothetical protein
MSYVEIFKRVPDTTARGFVDFTRKSLIKTLNKEVSIRTNVSLLYFIKHDTYCVYDDLTVGDISRLLEEEEMIKSTFIGLYSELSRKLKQFRLTNEEQLNLYEANKKILKIMDIVN